MATKRNSIMLVPKTSTAGFLSFPSINAAVNAARAGDLIVLEPGPFIELPMSISIGSVMLRAVSWLLTKPAGVYEVHETLILNVDDITLTSSDAGAVLLIQIYFENVWPMWLIHNLSARRRSVPRDISWCFPV